MPELPEPISSARSNFDAVRLFIEYVAPSRPTDAPRQTKRHSLQQVKKLARAIDRGGFNVPILVNDDYQVVSGHARLAAAQLLELSQVPVIRISHLSEEQLRLFAIFDNRISTEGTIDTDAVRLELEEISLASPELDLTDSGFEIAEIDAMNGLHRVQELDDLGADEPPKPAPISRLGDLWQLGRHRLICGDATDADVISRLVDKRPVRAIIADVPYNIRIPGVVSGKGRNQHADFAMASGEMSEAQFVDFLHRFFTAAQPNLVDGALAFVFIDWRHVGELLAAGKAAALDQKQLLVWVKSNPAMGGLYRNAHELIALFKHGNAPHTDNVKLGRFGRNRSNVLHYPGANVPTKGRRKALELHPTVKPAALIADLILDVTAPRELVLDSFGGSGTTLLAAEAVDRDACLCELDPGYVDVIIERFRAKTGIEAVLVDTSQTFAEVESERRPLAADGREA